MSQHPFDPSGFVDAVRDTFTVRRVFGEPYERDGILVIPVAKIIGASGLGSGAGEGPAEQGSGHGGGGGLGVRAVPIGVFYVDDIGAHWKPTLDLNRALLGGQLVLGAVLVTALATRALRRR